MKKLLATLVVAFLLATGLVAGIQSTASAACPYEGCLPTRTTGTAKVKAGKATVRGKVRAVDSNAKPVGSVIFTVKRAGGKKVLFKARKPLPSTANITFVSKKFGKGNYQFALQYRKQPDSRFYNSIGKGKFKVQ